MNENNNPNLDRNLVNVFKELQQKRAEDGYKYQHKEPQKNNLKNNLTSGITTYFNNTRKFTNPYAYGRREKRQKQAINSTKTFSYTKLSVCLIIITLIVSLSLLYLSYSFTTYGLEEDQQVATATEPVEFEENQHVIDIVQIASANVDTTSFKETLNEERELQFPIKYQTIDTLPKGEEQVVQEGVSGTNRTIAVRTYDENQLVDEKIIEEKVVKEPVTQIVNIGTSEFLAKFKVHLGDVMYVTKVTPLKEAANADSNTITDIPEVMDVTLLELAGDWSKVSYDGKNGYVPNDSLTSAAVAPEMVERARSQRLLKDVNIDMPLNKKSGLSLQDYQKILTGNVNDKNKIFEQNYAAFYEVEQKYNVNGVFLIALAIHESAWGTSNIAVDKKNLFGYGSYDSDPYNQSFVFNEYKDGIDLVAKVLAKNYLNPKDTPIYDGEVAAATYYNGATLAGVNVRYSTDPEWHNKVYNYMETLYKKLMPQ